MHACTRSWWTQPGRARLLTCIKGRLIVLVVAMAAVTVVEQIEQISPRSTARSTVPTVHEAWPGSRWSPCRRVPVVLGLSRGAHSGTLAHASCIVQDAQRTDIRRLGGAEARGQRAEGRGQRAEGADGAQGVEGIAEQICIIGMGRRERRERRERSMQCAERSSLLPSTLSMHTLKTSRLRLRKSRS